jgi:hypothetical protein
MAMSNKLARSDAAMTLNDEEISKRYCLGTLPRTAYQGRHEQV